MCDQCREQGLIPEEPLKITFVGGPLDGGSMDWQWYDNEKGHAGYENGVLLMGYDLGASDEDNLRYDMDTPKQDGIARYKGGRPPADIQKALEAGLFFEE